MVQTVLVQDYWKELQRGFVQLDVEVFHVVLDAEDAILTARIAGDQVERGAEQWRVDHLASYHSARSWMIARADLVVDTTCLTPAEVASQILCCL
jgi:hypothetical protein